MCGRAETGSSPLVACLEGYATLAAAGGQAREALLLDGAAMAQRGAIGTPRSPFVVAELDRALASARATLGAREAEVAHAAGGAMTLDELLDTLRDHHNDEDGEWGRAKRHTPRRKATAQPTPKIVAALSISRGRLVIGKAHR